MFSIGHTLQKVGRKKVGAVLGLVSTAPQEKKEKIIV